MTRMTGPDCAVMCNLLNTHTQHTHTHTHRKPRGAVAEDAGKYIYLSMYVRIYLQRGSRDSLSISFDASHQRSL